MKNDVNLSKFRRKFNEGNFKPNDVKQMAKLYASPKPILVENFEQDTTSNADNFKLVIGNTPVGDYTAPNHIKLLKNALPFAMIGGAMSSALFDTTKPSKKDSLSNYNFSSNQDSFLDTILPPSKAIIKQRSIQDIKDEMFDVAFNKYVAVDFSSEIRVDFDSALLIKKLYNAFKTDSLMPLGSFSISLNDEKIINSKESNYKSIVRKIEDVLNQYIESKEMQKTHIIESHKELKKEIYSQPQFFQDDEPLQQYIVNKSSFKEQIDVQEPLSDIVDNALANINIGSVFEMPKAMQDVFKKAYNFKFGNNSPSEGLSAGFGPTYKF